VFEEVTPLYAAKRYCEPAVIDEAQYHVLLAGVGKYAKRVGAQGSVTLAHVNSSFSGSGSTDASPGRDPRRVGHCRRG
jgi:hypothetical protein